MMFTEPAKYIQLAKYHSTVRYPDTAGQSQPNLSNLQLQANAEA